MHSKKIKKISVVVLIIFSANLLLYFVLSAIYKREIENYLAENNRQAEIKVNSSINTYNLVSETIFSQIINTEKVLKVFSQASKADSINRQLIRDSLYNLLKGTYEHLKSLNIKQLHFHLPNNESFLRFHRPDKYGDNLSDIRFSVKKANEEKKVYHGFEEGRIYNGFRYVFPLKYSNNHLGTVETSFSFEAINVQLKLLGVSYCAFALDKNTVLEKVFVEEQENYVKSLFSDSYVIEKAFSHYATDTTGILEKIDSEIKNRIAKRLEEKSSFSIHTKIDKNYYVVNFVIIKNLEQLPIAYIVTYEKDLLINVYTNRFKFSLIIGFLIIPVIIILLRLYFEKNKKIKEQNIELRYSEEKLKQYNQELLALNDNIFSQKQELEVLYKDLQISKENTERAHKEIVASINYANIIQKSLLTSSELLDKFFSDYFLLYQPRDIVSGDFYYVNEIEKNLIIAVADCTGHGVSGGFITVIGITYIHDIVRRNENSPVGDILNILRQRIKRTFKAFGSDSKNGLDISFCKIDKETRILQYAGANSPLWIIRSQKLIEYPATRNPIGFYPKEVEFETVELQLHENDMVYMFSDGFIDQFGGETGREFQKNKLRKLLIEISGMKLSEQKIHLNSVFHNWKGKNKQTDDITFLGFKI